MSGHPLVNNRRAQTDPITFEVLRNALVAVVDEMGLMLEKVAFSLVVSEGGISAHPSAMHGGILSQTALRIYLVTLAQFPLPHSPSSN